MNEFLISIIESLVLVLALSSDALFASFAYGTKQIKIPALSAIIISTICTLLFASTLLLGNILRPFISPVFTKSICFLILFVLGLIKLFDSFVKVFIKKTNAYHKFIKFHMFDLKFVLAVYAEPEKADSDCSKVLSPTEALTLAIALSLDGVAVGFGAGVANFNTPMVILFSLLFNLIAIYIGCFIGNKVSKTTKTDFSWISGLMLVILAFTKLF